MAFKIMSVSEVNERFRPARASSVEGLEDWIALRAKMSDGLKRNEAVVVELSNDPKNKNVRAAIKRHAKRYIKRLKLSYSVRALRDEATGGHIVIVANDEQPVSPRRK